jgi:hypothetical protein
VAGAGVLSACATEKTDTARLEEKTDTARLEEKTDTARLEEKTDTARLEYDRSVADYQNCIAANQMSTCEAEPASFRPIKECCSAVAPHTEEQSTF